MARRWVERSLRWTEMTEVGPSNRFEGVSRARRWAFIGTASLALFLVLFALAEGAVRIRAWLKHGQADIRIEDLYHYDESIGLRVPTPGYTSPRLTINSLGFRSPEIAKAKPPETYRIAFLGGSTTFCAEVSSDEQTWPHLVVEALKAAHPSRSFDYLNAGVPGYTTRESRKRFEAEVSQLDADLVVIYHATNDLSANSRKVARSQGLASEAGDKDLLWLSRWSMLSYLVEKNLKVLSLQVSADEQTSKLDADPADLAAPFEEDLRSLVQTVKASGAQVALASFSTRLRHTQSQEQRKASAITALYYMPYMTPDSLLDAFDAYNLTIRKLAQEEGAIFIDLAGAVPADAQHFTDSAHFSDQGARTVADVVTAELARVVP